MSNLYFTLKKNTKDDFIITVDVNNFRETVAKYFSVSPDDENALTNNLKPILLDSEKFEEFCEKIDYEPTTVVELMVTGRFDVLSEHRIIPKLKQYFRMQNK